VASILFHTGTQQCCKLLACSKSSEMFPGFVASMGKVLYFSDFFLSGLAHCLEHSLYSFVVFFLLYKANLLILLPAFYLDTHGGRRNSKIGLILQKLIQ
jgi:hypothetical protein